jgi:hypothetical protein
MLGETSEVVWRPVIVCPNDVFPCRLDAGFISDRKTEAALKVCSSSFAGAAGMVLTSSRTVVAWYTPERQQWLVPQLLAHPQLICCDPLLEASLQIQKATMHALSKLQANWPRAKKTGSRRKEEERAEQG